MNLTLIFILGLSIGSFLNVVIYRIPLMLEGRKINITKPKRSFCPQCQTQLGALELLPVVSFLWQKGKCKHCQSNISWQYPLVEITSAIMSVWLVWQLDISIEAGFYLVFFYALLALFVIDAKHQLLPDVITLPLLWLGLIFHINSGIITLNDAVIGAVLGYLILWLTYWGFKITTGKDGMGYGDFKLTAALGAWLGWQSLPLLLVIASVLSIIYFFLIWLYNKSVRHQAFAFGPFLIVASIFLLPFSKPWTIFI